MLFVLTLLISVSLVVAGLAIERGKADNAPFNAVCGFVQMVVTELASDTLAPGVLWLGGALGKPVIHLPSRGWMFPLALLVSLVLIDLLNYFFHRIEHKWLWALHSFHHSDPAMNATTAYRHFWLDRVLYAVWMLPLGLVLRVDGSVILAIIAASWVLNVWQHLDVKIGLGKLSWLVITPQLHRTHHSIEQRHYDANFANFLPVWDVIFGTYLEPDGYPETGLDEGEPQSLKEALLWGLRARTHVHNREALQ